jgi:ligand-binding sensor protein
MNEYDLAKSLNEKQIQNVLNSWNNDSEIMSFFKMLVKMGDSREMAMATSMIRNANSSKIDGGESYRAAYTN